ncbi:MAG: YebC/PmpR family DNA-binding transcriptional regulator [Deltaproteobacteria bacterium]|nr:YebC/PmpR family DNA-binding transcriptional regulator [Deltaproteobacteria bacterium]
MSGHNKWSTIKHKKGAADAKRGKIFSRLIKEITIAARMGGGDLSGNPRLRTAVLAGKAENMPKENIERAIKKGTGEIEGVSYDEFTYEGYGPAGAAVLVNVLTDNKNRAAADVRHIFAKCGGNLGESGCVAWMFSKKGTMTVAKDKASEDQLMEVALDAGAEDVVDQDDSFEVQTSPEDFETVKEALEKAGIPFTDAEVAMVPQNTVALAGKEAEQMMRLLETLDDCDDVQNVTTNADFPDFQGD